jgi:hypothetical protein
MNRRRVAPALLAALFALALPGAACAETYLVNDTGDAADAVVGSEGCDSIAGGAKQCTLRAAIQESDNSTSTDDVIAFDGTLFNGDGASKIAISGSFPAITDKTKIDGDLNADELGQCEPLTGILGPCVQLERSDSGSGLTVEADEVEIEGMSIVAMTGASSAGIDVIDSSEGFEARDNWIGIRLDGGAEGNTTGIFIGPGSDGATIGGTAPAERNVIGDNAGVGLDLEGASNATIQGNYFGVTPKGDTGAANAQSIEMTDSTAGGGFQAENNEIGAVLSAPASNSPECDGGCNVISGPGSRGLDLNGAGPDPSEAPTSGPTTVHGNFFGLNAAGTAAIASSSDNLVAGGADHVTVGAAAPSPIPPEANYVASGGSGISSGKEGNDFEARGNIIGLTPGGAAVTAPISGGVSVDAKNVSEGATIESNHIRMPGGIAIEHRFGDGRIVDNDIEGGAVGIFQWAAPGGGLIAGNVVEDSIDAGIVLESPDTDVRRNSIFDSAGAGISVTNRPGVATNGSRIGNDTAEGENLIEGSNGPAIEILEEATSPGSTTEVDRNRGSGNSGLFIDLVAGANEGILPPVFATSQQSSASGTAQPGARVRVFRKASADAGELQSFLAEAVADGAGNWSVSYPPVPAGTLVAATQTSVAGGTSELAIAATPADPGTGGGGGGGEKKPDLIGDPPCAFTAGKCRWPETTITAGPKAKTHATTVKFRFSSDMPGSTFECKLDKKPFKKCRSPKKYKKLKPGKHVFKVRAIDANGTVDPVPAKRKFRVLSAD